MNPIGYGTARLALVSVRKEPSHQSEQVTQLLFGEYYEVLSLSSNNEWLRIRIYADKYEGWLDRKQHYSVSANHFNQINRTAYRVATDLTSSLLYNRNRITVLIGSVLPISSSEIVGTKKQFDFNGNSKSLEKKEGIDFLKDIAMRYLHAPYEWGGRSPFGIDCSGFIQLIFKIGGYNLFRDAHQQAKQGKAINTARCAKPGDLAFFAEKSGKISHVGLILNDYDIIHASGKVQIDQWTENGITHAETGALTHTLVHICEIIQNPITAGTH